MLNRDFTIGNEKTYLMNQTISIRWGLLAVFRVALMDIYYIGRLGVKPFAYCKRSASLAAPDSMVPA